MQAFDAVDAFIDTVRSREIFERGTLATIARAPGRLDVMGGIADYSGSLVLQRPIAEATFVALQTIEAPVLEITSLGRQPLTISLGELAPGGIPVTYTDARDLFASPSSHWASYVAGVFLVLMRERGIVFSSGARLVVASSVPEGKGVSSSAALETASMQAAASVFGIPLTPDDLALLCQKAENLVAGAPCGIMDQMTCVFGEQDSLMALLCQPAELQPPVPLPDDISLWGLDSGERHAVSGSDYGAVRTGAFMGQRILMERDGVPADYLANIPLPLFERECLPWLPDAMSGAEFLERYTGTNDTVTAVDPGRVYRIRQPAAHPVYEHDRVREFRQLLQESGSEARRVRLGELMYVSHASYSACGLGSPGTDRIVHLVRREGAAAGLYGARITGGGSGGTVVILGRRDAAAAMKRVADRFGEVVGQQPYLFSGSSPGAAAFGVRSVRL